MLHCMLQLLGSKFIMDSGVITVPQTVCPDSECGRALRCEHCARTQQGREGSQELCRQPATCSGSCGPVRVSEVFAMTQPAPHLSPPPQTSNGPTLVLTICQALPMISRSHSSAAPTTPATLPTRSTCFTTPSPPIPSLYLLDPGPTPAFASTTLATGSCTATLPSTCASQQCAAW